MFRFFEGLVDPYAPYEETDTPPTRLYPFLRAYAEPFMRVFWITALVSGIIAFVEIWLLGYLGRLVDVLTDGTPAQVWADHGTEFIVVAILILTVRPAVHVFQLMLLNNTILPNFGTLVRWRAHRHVLRQSVGSRMILQAALPTGSCRHRPQRVKLFFNCLMRLHLPSPILSRRRF